MANKALEHGLRVYDKRHGWRKPARNVLAEKHTIEGFRDERWTRSLAAGDIVQAVVVTAPKTGAALLLIGDYHADLDRPGYSWNRRPPAGLFKLGDVVDAGV